MYNLKGEHVEDLELSDFVFAAPMQKTLLHETAVAMEANARPSVAHTKTRGEVSGGGKKPWKQKGTGRARHGSSRSPLWRAGGITFGPRPDRNYSKKINAKVRGAAMRMVLSDKLKNGEILAIDKVALRAAKTKELFLALSGALHAINKKISGKNLLVMENNKQAEKACRNLADIINKTQNNLSVLDILKSNLLIIEKEAIKKLEERLGK